MLSSRVMIENVLSDNEIKNAIALYGYDENKLKSVKILYDEVMEMHNKQNNVHFNKIDKITGEQHDASRETWKAWEKANAVYMKTLKAGRIALQNNAKAENAMMLYGDRKKSLSGWLIQVEAFYKKLMEDADLMNEMQKFGYTMDKLNIEYGFVKNVMIKNLKQKEEKDEAEEAVELMNKKTDELDKRLSDFGTIIKKALSDNPQKLEKLGILVKSKRAANSKKKPVKSKY